MIIICITCRLPKPTEEFYKNPLNKFYSSCKECCSIKGKLYRKSNPETKKVNKGRAMTLANRETDTISNSKKLKKMMQNS